ncbi:MAG TPA: hypothetical protein EYP42_04495 [Aquificales bacterium]|uniref:Uncharacterized protein n=1 Tax=Aquifex aeolicus TaxID=63363 RepID=A0A9D0YPA6_AQUAO|nr:hypothetical protein [Aquificales bacterium]HIP97967.1 hypothetical protein [Aquifex aeolicus]
MWKGKVFKTLVGLLLSFPLFGGDVIYTPKVFFDTSRSLQSVKSYDRATAQFLSLIDKDLRGGITDHLLRKGIVLLLKNGIGSDLTVFYTFPQAYIYKISLKKEIGTTTYWRYGYRVDITLALYVFKNPSNPRLVLYRTYRYVKYYPPKGEYLPLNVQMARAIATAFYQKLTKELDHVIEEEKKRLEYYKNLGKD